jgi:hypothetical protein
VGEESRLSTCIELNKEQISLLKNIVGGELDERLENDQVLTPRGKRLEDIRQKLRMAQKREEGY